MSRVIVVPEPIEPTTNTGPPVGVLCVDSIEIRILVPLLGQRVPRRLSGTASVELNALGSSWSANQDLDSPRWPDRTRKPPFGYRRRDQMVGEELHLPEKR